MDTSVTPGHNRLSKETSPYLLQHAGNPVDWYPWSEEALAKARSEDKPIVLSIGYSACHWCHVMERETFENEQIAALMNTHYVCIKVDREERPDIDQLYMDALHAMGLPGGWPLNVILTPHGKPFYGGTYFPPQKWANMLLGVQEAFVKDRQKLEDSAQGFAANLTSSEKVKYGLQMQSQVLEAEQFQELFRQLATKFDRQKGGTRKAPKFPMPCVWEFVLRYAHQFQDQDALMHVYTTLDRMALGGIFDQIGGGFARYSTDEDWFAPHFEKMLYDNGQLLSLYAHAWQQSKKELYKEVATDIIAFVKSELTSPDGGFYAALDADSEGAEGRFYVWSFHELDLLALPEKEVFLDYYQVEKGGSWEEGTNILYRTHTAEDYCKMHQLPLSEFLEWEKQWKKLLLTEREKRTRPGLDTKIIASWNGLMLNGITDAYRIFDEPDFLALALQNARFIKENLMEEQEGMLILFHLRTPEKTVPGFLEDYAAVIQAYTNLYQATFDAMWLDVAARLTASCLAHFFDSDETLFYFTSSASEQLITRKKEVFDNVVPASNSIMAHNLVCLGHLLSHDFYLQTGEKMVRTVQQLITQDVYYLSNWAIVTMELGFPLFEIAICGSDAHQKRKELDQLYLPGKVLAGSIQPSTLPLLEGRWPVNGKTLLYVCRNKTCHLPVATVTEALEQLRAE